MFKNKLTILIFIALLFSLTPGNIYAIDVPLPGLPNDPDLPTYIEVVFNLLISIAGILSVVSFAIGSVQFIASGDNPEANSNAKSRIKSSVLGLILTMTAFIILQTINPQLTAMNFAGLGDLPGVTIGNGSKKMPCPASVADINTELPENYNQINYTCPDDVENPPKLLIWDFPEKKLEEGNTNESSKIVSVSMKEISCGSSTSVSGKSFKIAFEVPGVYFYQQSCGGYMSSVYNTSVTLPDTYKGKVGGIKIVDDDTKNIFYGAIFHQISDPQKAGKCSDPISGNGGGGCQTVDADIAATAADVFRITKETPEDGGSSGVVFYSEPFGEALESGAGYNSIAKSSITYPYYSFDPGTGFQWTNVSVTESYKTFCPNFQMCKGSLHVLGDYLVEIKSTDSYCRTFSKNVANFRKETLTAAGSGKTIESIYIIPISNKTQ